MNTLLRKWAEISGARKNAHNSWFVRTGVVDYLMALNRKERVGHYLTIRRSHPAMNYPAAQYRLHVGGSQLQHCLGGITG